MKTLSRTMAAVLGLTAPLFLSTATSATVTPTIGTSTAGQHPHGISQLARPVVIGHRGAAGYRLEHTIAGYKLAIRMGADYIEPDLVTTKNGVLVVRHENNITGTTDVADHPEFADRMTTKVIDGVSQTGWFTEDFTLAEIKTLRAKERLPDVRPQNTKYDGRFRIPTFNQVLDLADRQSRITGRRIGVYPETKHPTYFDSIGLSLEEPLLSALKRHHLDKKQSKVVIQSFETANLRELNRKTPVFLVQLIDASGAPYDLVAAGDPRTYRDLTTPAGLSFVDQYADGVGVNKDLVLPRDPATGATGEPSALVTDAHAQGLRVHIWTMRAENQFMATNFRRSTDPNAAGDLYAEAQAFLDAGVDGKFSDNPDVAVEARDDWVAEQQAVS
jgi:glycerophosphoryl diester phosphodiesterase